MILNKELGYYRCNGVEFASKIEAYVYAHQHQKPVEWFFNDQAFNAHDWTIEPPHTLEYYYDRRARELREKYDYVIVSYSGGVDSHNLLTSFIRQGLHVDEIIVNTFEKANKTIDNNDTNRESWNYGAEYKLQIYPRLEELRHKIPLTKITIADMSDYLFSHLTESGDESWVFKHKEVLNPSGISRYNYLHLKEVHNNFDKQKSIALIVGAEKPSTFIRNGDFYFIFLDRGTNITPVDIHYQDYTNTTVEYFYWHPSCAEMIIKQAHTIKKWLELNPRYQPLWTVNTKDEYSKHSHIRQPLLRDIIYPGIWNHDWFQVSKGKRFWTEELDNWFHELYAGTDAHKIWSAGIEWVKQNAASLVTSDQDGFEACYKMYKVGPITNRPRI